MRPRSPSLHTTCECQRRIGPAGVGRPRRRACSTSRRRGLRGRRGAFAWIRPSDGVGRRSYMRFLVPLRLGSAPSGRRACGRRACRSRRGPQVRQSPVRAADTSAASTRRARARSRGVASATTNYLPQVADEAVARGGGGFLLRGGSLHTSVRPGGSRAAEGAASVVRLRALRGSPSRAETPPVARTTTTITTSRRIAMLSIVVTSGTIVR